jgi:hypothetical protein
VQVGDADVSQRPRPPGRRPVHLLLAALDLVFDALGVDPPVGTSASKRHPGHLAAHRVEAAEEHSLGRVVDDQVHAGDLLERADVAALTADDAALHLVAWQVQHRDDGLRRLLGGDALDRRHDDLARPCLPLLLRGSLDVAGDDRRVTFGLGLDGGDQLVLGLLQRHAGNPLQHREALGVELAQLPGAHLELVLPLAQRAGAFLQVARLLGQSLFTLGDAVLAALDVEALLADVVA